MVVIRLKSKDIERDTIEEDEPIDKSGKYLTWEEDDNMVMSWIMESVQPQIASTITYYTTAKEMWEFLRQTYSQDKISNFKPTMVAKFLAGLSHEYAAAKDQMLTGSETPDLFDAYNKLSRLTISLSQPAGVTPASTLVVGGGRGQGTTIYSARGRGIGRGTRGCERFQCTYCGKMGHLEDRCRDKHGRPSTISQGRGMVTKQGKNLNHLPLRFAQVATPTLDGPSSSTVSETVTVSIDRFEYEQLLAHKPSQALAS
ncbi:hypothetical protein EJ110_NYTH23763 [Nymphaea thermarum]|nr:hypothetical protein EJ110_NYTH23763 [Nymphaea thermarum]